MVKAVSTKSGLAGRFDRQTAVNQLLGSCTDFLRSVLQHHLNPGAEAGARVFASRVVPVAAGPADVTLKLAVDPTNWSELDSSDIAVFPGFLNNCSSSIGSGTTRPSGPYRRRGRHSRRTEAGSAPPGSAVGGGSRVSCSYRDWHDILPQCGRVDDRSLPDPGRDFDQ